MKVVVGTTAQSIPLGGRGRPLIQNNGPGTVALDTDATATMTDGYLMSPGDSYEFLTPGSDESVISLIADQDSDVRIITMGA